MSEEIAIKKPPFRVGTVGLAAKKAALAQAEPLTATPTKPSAEMEHRIGIVFDDSGSMCGEPIKNAHAGVEEFLRSCKPQETAVAIYPMNTGALKLSTDLPALAMLVRAIPDSGGTPLVHTLEQMLQHEKLTRAIVFSDGSPDNRNIDNIVTTCKEKSIPVDAVFIGDGNFREAIDFMKNLAERTGGIFLHFDPSKSNFRTAFKYLAPGLRLQLADKSFADRLQGK
jgi:Mg-chelatase subunit ChlD